MHSKRQVVSSYTSENVQPIANLTSDMVAPYPHGFFRNNEFSAFNLPQGYIREDYPALSLVSTLVRTSIKSGDDNLIVYEYLSIDPTEPAMRLKVPVVELVDGLLHMSVLFEGLKICPPGPIPKHANSRYSSVFSEERYIMALWLALVRDHSDQIIDCLLYTSDAADE